MRLLLLMNYMKLNMNFEQRMKKFFYFFNFTNIILFDKKKQIRSLNTALIKKEDELRHEKELFAELEATKKSYEQQLRDLQSRIDETDEIARREAKRISAKLETRVE